MGVKMLIYHILAMSDSFKAVLEGLEKYL